MLSSTPANLYNAQSTKHKDWKQSVTQDVLKHKGYYT